MARDRFVTLSGQGLQVVPYREGQVPDSDALGLYYEVTDASGSLSRVCVEFRTPETTDVELHQKRLGSFQNEKSRLAVFAILDGVEENDPALGAPGPVKRIVIEPLVAVELLDRPKAHDRDIRRYIARRVHDMCSRSTLDVPVPFDEDDFRYLGAQYADFVRCAQVLEEEKYLKIYSTGFPDGLKVTETARLVRDVERYGAAREDVKSDQDYSATLRAWPRLALHAAALSGERTRYATATSEVELLSVFRATAPIVEAIVRELLTSHGSAKSYAGLGSMIGDLHALKIAPLAILSQLDHVLKFGRDVTEHGHSLPVPVLRIACENAFELPPQLAALFP